MAARTHYLSRHLILLALVCGALQAQQYFPAGALDGDSGRDRAKSERYSSLLKGLREPSLWELSQKDPHAEAYRFLWLRAFDRPVSVRFTLRTNGTAWLHTKVSSHTGTGDGGGNSSSLSWMPRSWARSLQTAFTNAHLLEPRPPREYPTAAGIEGAEWILEGVKDGRYDVIDRWSPPIGDPVREAGVAALKRAHGHIRERDIY
jgi:hypothetical protein